MADDICFREVIPDELFPEKWKEFTVNIGGTQALQEVKVPERAGGYAFKNQVKLYSRNRFLYWRTCDDVLELVEQSLDLSLSGRALRIRFPDTPVLEGVSVHEAERAIVVLCSTVSSVHKFSFPLPDSLCSEDSAEFALAHHPDIGIKSIFADTTQVSVRDPSTFHVLNSVASGVGLPHVSASLLTLQGDCLFALGYPSGNILLVQLGASGQEVSIRELKEETFVPRFLSGITNALTGGRGAPVEAPVSLALHSHGLDTHLFCLHRDGVLAMWSCSRVALVSTLELAQVCGGDHGQRATEGVQSHVLRKAQDARDGPALLAAFLCFAGGSMVCLANASVISPGGALKLNLLCAIAAPPGDLVDLSLSGGALWAAWRSPDGPIVSRTALGPSLDSWRFALLDAPLPDLESSPPPPGDDADAAEMFLQYIFHSPHFSAPVIARALALFRRSGPAGSGSAAAAAAAAGAAVGTGSWRALRERVARAVEADIRRQAAGAELTDDDYTELAYASWSRFYSGCVQYAEAAARPLAVVALGPTAHAGAALLKRKGYSLLRPMDPIEQQMLMPMPADWQSNFQGAGMSPCGDDRDGLSVEPEAEDASVRALTSTLSLVEARCPAELKAAMDVALEETSNPESWVAQLFRAPPSGDTEPLLAHDFLEELGRRLSATGDLCLAVGALLRRMELEPSPVEAEVLAVALAPGAAAAPSAPPPAIASLLASHAGLSITTRTLHQVCLARLAACRALLLLLRLLAERRLEVGATAVGGAGVVGGGARLDALRSSLVPHAVVAAQALHSLAWLAVQPAARASRPSLEAAAELLGAAGAQRLAAAARAHAATAGGAGADAGRAASLLGLLLRGPLGAAARAALAARPPPEEALCGAGAALPLARVLCRATWPARETPAAAVGALLLAAGQRRAAAEYERLLGGWCEGGVPLRRFALGAALLLGGEPRKALEALQAAAAPRDAARQLLEQLGGGGEGTDDSLSPAAQYALLLARLFSLGKHWDLVLALAEAAAWRAQADVPGGGVEERSTLQLVAFSAQLRLGRLAGAFQALLAVPERQRARLCLRQLVAHSFERRQLKQLLAFPYGALVDDLSSQVLSRARAQAPDGGPHYSFLYALHMGRGAARKAAAAMLEQALRARAELPAAAAGVRLRTRCLLACLNALRLAQPNFRWLVRPEPNGASPDDEDALCDAFATEDGEERAGGALARRRPEDAAVLALAPRRRVALLTLGDVEREYLLAAAHLQLLRRDMGGFGTVAGDLSPAEVVGACTGAGLYETALQVALRWGLPPEPIVRHLATECVELTRRGMLNAEQTWSWLKENDVWEFGIGDAPALSLAWKLLEVLLSRLEPLPTAGGDAAGADGAWGATQSAAAAHLAAAGALLRAGAFLPLWLLRACAARAAPRLLRLLAAAGRLEEAAALATAALWRALGRHAKAKPLTGPGTPFAEETLDVAALKHERVLCMPIHLVDCLLLELQTASQADPKTYTEPLEELRCVRDKYITHAEYASKELMRRTPISAVVMG